MLDDAIIGIFRASTVSFLNHCHPSQSYYFAKLFCEDVKKLLNFARYEVIPQLLSKLNDNLKYDEISDFVY